MVQTRLSFNLIRSFVLPSGAVIVDDIQMSNHDIAHFKIILGPVSAPTPVVFSSSGWVQSLTEFSCSPALSLLMTTILTAEEITSVLFKLNPNKSPGPDGLTSGFYKASCSISRR